jgi:hypothetical protein
VSYRTLSTALTGMIPGLPPMLAQDFIRRAWADIRDSRLWGFRTVDGAVVCPAQVTAGAVSMTQFGLTVLGNATASAAWLALGATPGLLTMQIRFTGTVTSQSLYSIIAVDASVPTAVVLTLDRPITDGTDVAAAYQLYRCYVSPPIADFIRWESFVDGTNGWTLQRNVSSAWFDTRDPQRQSQGQAYYLGYYQAAATTAIPRYELWPHPTSGQIFYARMIRRGPDFSAHGDTQPAQIPDALILDRALGWFAYPWAAANVGRVPTLKGAGWVNLMTTSRAQYLDHLLEARREDDEQTGASILSRGHGLRQSLPANYTGPIDSAYMQRHPVTWSLILFILGGLHWIGPLLTKL